MLAAVSRVADSVVQMQFRVQLYRRLIGQAFDSSGQGIAPEQQIGHARQLARLDRIDRRLVAIE